MQLDEATRAEQPDQPPERLPKLEAADQQHETPKRAFFDAGAVAPHKRHKAVPSSSDDSVLTEIVGGDDDAAAADDGLPASRLPDPLTWCASLQSRPRSAAAGPDRADPTKLVTDAFQLYLEKGADEQEDEVLSIEWQQLDMLMLSEPYYLED